MLQDSVEIVVTNYTSESNKLEIVDSSNNIFSLNQNVLVTIQQNQQPIKIQSSQ